MFVLSENMQPLSVYQLLTPPMSGSRDQSATCINSLSAVTTFSCNNLIIHTHHIDLPMPVIPNTTYRIT